MDDLREGQGVSPPIVRTETRWNSIFETPTLIEFNGRIDEGNDLSREAIGELLRREKAGTLPPECRGQIDKLALADLAKPLKTPGQYYLRQNLGDRLYANTLPADEQKRLYQTALSVTLDTDPVVIQWNDVPIRLRYQCSLPNSTIYRWAIQAKYKSIRIDGESTPLSPKQWDPLIGTKANCAFGFEEETSGGEKAYDSISYSKLGSHRIEIELQVDVRTVQGTYEGPIIHSEVISLSTDFLEKPPSLIVKCFRYLIDPNNNAIQRK